MIEGTAGTSSTELNLCNFKDWIKEFKDALAQQEKPYIDLVKSKFKELPKCWYIIFPLEYEHEVPHSLRDKIKFSQFVKGAIYILNADYMKKWEWKKGYELNAVSSSEH